jgi:hypothetical protein
VFVEFGVNASGLRAFFRGITLPIVVLFVSSFLIIVAPLRSRFREDERF